MNKFIFLVFLGLATVGFVLSMPVAANAQYTGCTYHSYQQCAGNDLYWYDSCGQQQSYIGVCNDYNNNYNNYGNCAYHSYQQCLGANLYWYNSCGQQQDYVGACDNYNYNNNYNYGYNQNYNNFSACTYHAYKLCQGNYIYWYSSCGVQQDLYSVCGGGQTCQYGQCTNYVQPYIPPVNNYVAHNSIKCYGSSLYWYDSLGVSSGVYKNCSDSNTCTLDSCSGSKCANTLKCDGTTCTKDSADYTKYCSSSNNNVTEKCGDGTCETTAGETSENCPSDCKLADTTGLSVSFFNRESETGQWLKTAKVGSDGQVYFMISVQNNSAISLSGVKVSANIPQEVYSLGNVKIDGLPVSGDIVSGIDIGPVPSLSAKSITFEGRTQSLLNSDTKQATTEVSVAGVTQSDSVSLEFTPNPAAATISGSATTSGFLGFLKNWYLWIFGGIVLIFLFAIVFRRLSSES